MCLGVPGKILEVDGAVASVDFWGLKRQIRLDIVDQPVKPGDYILNHVGFAIRRIPEEEIEETLALYEILLKEVAKDDMMAEDVRGEIAAADDPAAGDARIMSGSAGFRARPLEFRDPERARALGTRLAELVAEIERPESEPVSVMHVCGSHEQAIARFGLRSSFPAGLEVIMGPGCPVCVTDNPEVDEAVILAERGVHVATYGDMLRVPGTARSLAGAQARGAQVHVVYSPNQAVDLARRLPHDDVVFFASGFETTAVATAAVIVADPPANFSVLSAHKYIPPVMEIVAEMPHTRVEGYLAAGHAATITGWGIFERFVERHQLPVVVAGFEPLDILAGLVKLVELVAEGRPRVVNMFPRCVTEKGNLRAQEELWRVFRPMGGRWRGIAHVPNGNLRLRSEWTHLDARQRFEIDLARFWDSAPASLAQDCICGNIMSGIAAPTDCRLFGVECRPEAPVGACMVSSEGTCKIWHQYGGHPDLSRELAAAETLP